ncbi:MAG: hypothetical protein ACREX8_04800 [Gammaproteobacteria bacterium]
MVSLKRFARDLYDPIQVPISIVFLLDARTIHPAYGMTWPRRLARGFRMFPSTRRMTVATWWCENFARTRPGMIGSGCGLPLGTYYVGPWEERFHYPLQKPSMVADTRKGMSGCWSFYPEDLA